MPESVVADLVETSGQDVHQEPAEKLHARQSARPPAICFAVLVSERDVRIVHVDNPGVGDGDPEHVTCKIIEDRFFPVAVALAEGAPLPFPYHGR